MVSTLSFFFKGAFSHSSIFAHIVIGGTFVALASFWLLTGIIPTHDTIEWHGAWHYFYSSVARGVLPYWNPYSQTGTPFFNNFQSFGLLEPSQFAFVLFQKITGCTTLTTYLLHYLFMYYLFILGTYYTLRLITRHNTGSVIFSLVLLAACFPAFMRQDVKSYLFIPFITYFLFLFFKESRVNKKGFYLFIASFLFALSLPIHIPIWLLFYLLLFVVFAFFFRITEVKTIVQFAMNRYGLFWVSISIIIVLLISAPVFVLYHEIRHNTEYLPSLRFLQKNGNNLVKTYVSDLQENPFSENFTQNIKTSLSLGNLVGMFLEPFQYFERSEVVLYLSIFPLLCIWVALTKVRNRYTWIFSVIAGLVLLISCNFKVHRHTQAGFTQRIMMAIFPFLKMSDVLQSGGVLFLFCLVILSTIGFRRIRYSRSKVFWLAPLFFLSCKYLAFLYHSKVFVHQSLLFSIFVVSIPVFLLTLLLTLLVTLHRSSVIRLRQSAIAILLFDLLIFNVFHVIAINHILNKKYFNYLQRENLVQTKVKHAFINYRSPFSPLTPEHFYDSFFSGNIYFNTFFGHEIYNVKKVAFPVVVRAMQSRESGEKYLASWDHFYMTTYYYDYLVNVQHEKQLVTSNIITPILNFFPKDDAVWFENKYQVVEHINNASLDDLRVHIFIERDTTAYAQILEVSQFFDPANYVRYTQDEIDTFNRYLSLRYPANKEVSLSIRNYDINHLSLLVETPYDGYLYFGDGYSKHWKAFVDGKQTKIEKTNINFKSVYTPAGKHRVKFVFDPVLFRYSLYAYFLGNVLFLAIFVIFLSKKWQYGLQ